jgi:subtilase family serine protease
VSTEEISLDVLWAHAIAPGANITLGLAKSNNDADILSATKYAVDHNLGDVISQSFGENESCVDPSLLAQEHQVLADGTPEPALRLVVAGSC